MPKGSSLTAKLLGGSYLYLLITLLLFFVLSPFLVTAEAEIILLDVFLSAVLITGLYSVVHDRTQLVIALCLAGPAIVTRWTLTLLDAPWVIVASHVFSFAFFGFNTVTILLHIIRENRITHDTIYGAICGYLLLGLSWGLVFSLMEFVAPGSLALGSAHSGESARLASLMFYYCFVTLTTLGYGDIIPVSAPARSLSTLEAVLGQLYLTILIARLVGMYIARVSRE